MQVIIQLKDNAETEKFLKSIQEHDSIEWLETIEEKDAELENYHKQILDERLEEIEKGNAVFTDWEILKRKYECY